MRNRSIPVIFGSPLVYWTDLAQGSDQWRAVVNIGNEPLSYWVAAQLVASREGLISMESVIIVCKSGSVMIQM
jgi:hypothetical protein